jgi:hypothetical protein
MLMALLNIIFAFTVFKLFNIFFQVLRLHRVAKISPLRASIFLLLRQKKDTKEKATRFRSTALALNSFSWSEG